MHVGKALTQNIEIGCVRRAAWEKEVITTVGGREVRNNLWSSQRRSYELSLPACLRDAEDYQSLLEIWELTEGGNHTFDFTDWTDETTLKVRFDSDLQSTGLATHLEHVDTLTIIEVKE